jgi:tetratricopeptide (TPR) repeat protein
MSAEMLERIREIDWPTEQDMSPANRAQYESGLDLVYSYAGDCQELADALERFRDCGSGPHSSAGVALVLMFDAYDHGDVYDKVTLKEAEKWVSKIGPSAGQHAELAFVPVQLMLIRKQQQAARELLDQLHQRWPNNFFICKAELWYWGNKGNLEQCEVWAQRTFAAADTDVRKTIAITAAAGCYLRCHAVDRAISAYEELVRIDPGNPWHWHNLSLQYYNAYKFRRALECNERALSLGEFEAAREARQLIEGAIRSSPWKSIAIGVVAWLLTGAASYFAIQSGDARLWGLTIVGVPVGALFLFSGIANLRHREV